MSSGARFVASISDISISQRSGTYHHRLSSLDHISSIARTSDSSTGRSCRYLTLLADMALGGEKVASSLDQIVAERGVPGSITDALLRSFAKLTTSLCSLWCPGLSHILQKFPIRQLRKPTCPP
jgi:hypothetical protein